MLHSVNTHDELRALREVDSEWAPDLARRLIDGGVCDAENLSDGQHLAVAWAIKSCVDTAWSSDPSQVPRALDAMQLLRKVDDKFGRSSAIAEFDAISEWVHGIAEITRGRMSDAVVHLDAAAMRFRALGDALHAAEAQVPKIIALSVLGYHFQATECGLRARAEFLVLGDLHAAGKVSLNLGNLFCHRENYAEGLLHFQQASLLFSQTGDHQRYAMSDIGIGNSLASMGKFGEALEIYKRARIRSVSHTLPVLEAMVHEHVALVHLARGIYNEAFAGLENARRCYQLLDMPQHLATADKQLADGYLEVRLLPEALALFSDAIARFESLEMPIEQAWALTQRGRTLVTLDRPPEEVADSLRRAWDLFTAQGVSAGQAAVLLARAELALAQNDPEAALIFASDAAEAFASSALALGGAQADVVRAHALLQCANVDAAAALFARTLTRARDLQLLSIDVRCQVGLGLVAQASGDITVAEALFESAITASEEQRSALPGDEIRSAFLVDQLRPYEEVLRIALDAFDRAPSSDAAARVLLQLERFRARVLGERLGETKQRVSALQADDPDRDLRARLSWLYRRRQKLIDDGDDPQSLTEETRRLEHELLEIARRRRLTCDSSALSIDANAFDPAAVQNALGADEVLIEYGVVDDELFACVVTHEHVALKRQIARWPDVVEAIRTARFQIETLRYGAGAVDRHLELLTRRSRAAMRRVHELVWAPLQPLLAGYDKALIVAHAQLGSLQFAALYDGENYLAQTMNLAMAPSARVALYGMAHQPVAAQRALVLGESSRLVHAADEANFVAGLFDDANVLVGTEANSVALRASCVDADVLHLACHAEFRSDNPMFSALQLVDGPFNVQDAETLQLRQGIVVLSACETGVAVYSRGDEMVGLVRAFLVAGASRVVASLWPVDDAVTKQFMAAFYHSLHDGNTPSFALRTAQLEVMQTHPHPFHWAAFTLYGGW